MIIYVLLFSAATLVQSVSFENRSALQTALFECVGACGAALGGSGDGTYCDTNNNGPWVSGTGAGCNATSTHGNLSAWDVSPVTNMQQMFQWAKAFNGDLSKWKVFRVASMHQMFYGAEAFNGDLSAWDVSEVTDMQQMFDQASMFYGDLSTWNVWRVTNMQQMFQQADAFNGNLSAWDVSGVTSMHQMFYRARAFNGDLSAWDVSGVTDMQQMFYGATQFTGDLSDWPTTTTTTTTAAPPEVGTHVVFEVGSPKRISSCYGDNLTVIWNGTHNLIETPNATCSRKWNDTEWYDRHSTPFKFTSTALGGKYAGHTRYYMCADHCEQGARFEVYCPPEVDPNRRVTVNSTTAQLEMPALLVALCITGAVGLLLAMYVCPRRKKTTAYIAVKTEDPLAKQNYKPLKWVP